MNIQSVNNNLGIQTSCSVAKNEISTSTVSVPAEEGQKVFAKHLNFRGGVPLGNLINDYKWFVNNDKTPAINAFLKIDAPKESLQSLLRFILGNEETSYQFMDSVVKQPRNMTNVYKELRKKLPDNTDLLNIYANDNPYRVAYEKFLDRKYNEAQSVDELLKIRPDWKEEVLLNKYKALHHNDNFELGKVPEEIASDLDSIVNYLEIYFEYGHKSSKIVPDLNINSRNYQFHYITDGKSDKNVFKVTTPSGKNFIVKMADPKYKGLESEFGMGTTCKIDTYLTENGCRNSAPIRYYNHNKNLSIYDYVAPNPVPKRIQYDLTEFSRKMPDFKDLGLSQSDTVGLNNYFKMGHNQDCLKNTFDVGYGIDHGEYVSVDNDHVTYTQMLSPMIYKYFKNLPQSVGGMFF